jgi:hypothetical protein
VWRGGDSGGRPGVLIGARGELGGPLDAGGGLPGGSTAPCTADGWWAQNGVDKVGRYGHG